MVRLVVYMVMIVCTVVGSIDATNRWPERTRNDLDAIKSTVEKYKSVRAEEHVDLSITFQECIKRSSLVATLSDYQAVIAYCVSGFHDDALKLTWCRHPKKVCWPGFIITRQHDAYIVAYVSDRCQKNMLPPIGAELIACDGIPVARYMADYVMPYSFPSEADLAHLAPYIGLYNNHQWAHKISSCTYLVNGKQYSVPVVWNWRSYSRLHKHVDAILQEQLCPIPVGRQKIKEIQLPSKCAILTINR